MGGYVPDVPITKQSLTARKKVATVVHLKIFFLKHVKVQKEKAKIMSLVHTIDIRKDRRKPNRSVTNTHSLYIQNKYKSANCLPFPRIDCWQQPQTFNLLWTSRLGNHEMIYTQLFFRTPSCDIRLYMR